VLEALRRIDGDILILPVAETFTFTDEQGEGLSTLARLDQLEQCCLFDAEIDLGPEAWAAFEDPFPAWRIATAASEDGAEPADDDDDTLID